MSVPGAFVARCASCPGGCACEAAESGTNALPPGTIALMKKQAEILNNPDPATTEPAAETSSEPEPAPPVVDIASPAEGIRMFQQLQSGRVATYREFDQSLTALLDSGDMFSYQKQAKSITIAFNDCSTRAIQISKQLKSKFGGPATESSKIINTIQYCEQAKLQLTVKVHLARVNAPPSIRDILAASCECRDSCPSCIDTERDAIAEKELKQLRMKMAEVIGSINEKLEELRCERKALAIATSLSPTVLLCSGAQLPLTFVDDGHRR